jgi:hypothetical protein
MDNEQRFEISLDSPLDINSNDMLVPASSPKFSFNRQRYLGSVLQNSVRYEADGWFAGWWVHNFDFGSVGTVTISPDTIGTPIAQQKLIPGQNVLRYWAVRFGIPGLDFQFYTSTYSLWTQGNPTGAGITRVDDQTVRITGTTSGGNTFDVTTNAYTGAIMSASSSSSSIQFSGYYSGGLFRLTAANPPSVNDRIYIRFGDNIDFEGGKLYTFNGVTHDWGGFIYLDGDTAKLNASVVGYSITSQNPSGLGTATEQYDVTIQSEGHFTVKSELKFSVVGFSGMPWTFKKQMENTNSLVAKTAIPITANDIVNQEIASLFDKSTLGISPWADVMWQFPIWLRVGQEYEFSVEVFVYDRYPDPGGHPTYLCEPWLTIKRNGSSGRIQDKIALSATEVFYNFSIGNYDFSDDQIPVGTSKTVSLTNGIVNSAALPSSYPFAIKATCRTSDPDYPIKNGQVYGEATGRINIRTPTWVELPPPPPRWAFDNWFPVNLAAYLYTWPQDGLLAPTGWQNPVGYPVVWPPKPSDWANPVPYPATWPSTPPPGWTNPVTMASQTWGANPGGVSAADWTIFTATYQFGTTEAGLNWPAGATTPYLTYIGSAPTGWPRSASWPVPYAAWDSDSWKPNAPLPTKYPIWPFGVTGGPSVDWDTSTPYDTWILTVKPANWPPTNPWPVVPEGGWQPLVSGDVNPVAPATWTLWPPQWPFGILGLPVNEWQSTSITYDDYVVAYKPSNWPLAWAWQFTNSVQGTSSDWPWEVGASEGWVPRTGSAPNYTVNPVAPPRFLFPDWPPTYILGIDVAPPEWYSTSVSYYDWVKGHVPYKPKALDWDIGGDPGYAWPSNYYVPPPDLPSRPQTDYPFVVPAGYVVWTLNTDGTISLHDGLIPPVGWPDHVIVNAQAKGNLLSAKLGPDDYADGRQFYVLNRMAFTYQDRNILDVKGNNDPNVYPNPLPPDHEWSDTLTIKAIFPICLYAFTYNRITISDITTFVDGGSVGPEAFTVVELSNQTLGVKVFRLDENNQEGAYTTYSMEAIYIDISGASPVDSTGPFFAVPKLYEELITYRNATNMEFDRVVDYEWPGMPSVITFLQYQMPDVVKAYYGFYPQWVADSPGAAWWKKYTEVDGEAEVIYNLTWSINHVEWLTGLGGSGGVTVNYTPNIPINVTFANELRTAVTITVANAAGRDKPWAPGLAVEYLTFNLSGGDAVDFEFSPISGPLFNGNMVDAYFNPDPLVTWSKPAGDFYTFSRTSNELRTIYKLDVMVDRFKDYPVVLRKAFVIDKNGLMLPASITAATQDVVNLTATYGDIYRTQAYENYTAVMLVSDEYTSTTATIYVGFADAVDVTYLPYGIYWYNKPVRYVSLTPSGGGWQLVFIYEGTQYTLYLGGDVSSKLVYRTTDIRTGIGKDLLTANPADINMAVKQFWSSNTDIENYWWIDSTHVLALTKYDVELWTMTADLDDWNGNRWDLTKTAPRSNFFDTGKDYFDVSSSYEQAAYVFKISNTDTGITISYITNIVGANFASPTWTAVPVPVVQLKADKGTQTRLMTTAISAYVPVSINSLIWSAKISSTAIEGELIVGFALTRGMLQWAVRIRGSAATVVNGYGNVGHNGLLTGGQYPKTFTDKTGYMGYVLDVGGFVDLDDGTGVENKTYISGTTLWFVERQLDGIVSHLTYNRNGRDYEVAQNIIPLTNNYSYKAEFEAYGAAYLFDTLIHNLNISDFIDLLGDGAAQALSIVAGFTDVAIPGVYYVQPNLGVGVMSTQGMHQSAYVIRNSLPVQSDDGKSDRDVTVARRKVDIESTVNLALFEGLFQLIMGLVGSVLSDFSSDTLSINASMNSMTPDDTKGRKLGQFISVNIANALSTAVSTNGFMYNAKSSSTEVLSLSMFYSINDGTQCYAGPGFVNHNFIGQAVSQGISVTRLKLDKFGGYFPMQILSYIHYLGLMTAVTLAQQLLDKIYDQTGGANAGGHVLGSGADVPIVQIAIGLLNAGRFAAQKMVWLYDKVYNDILPASYKSYGEIARGMYMGGVNRNVIEPEAMHVYGNKPMSMFYPAFGTVNKNDPTQRKYINVESVESRIVWEPAELDFNGPTPVKFVNKSNSKNNAGGMRNRTFFTKEDDPFAGGIALPKDVLVGHSKSLDLPEKMSVVEGIVTMLEENSELKNLQINCVDYTFPAPPIHDYEISTKYGGIGVQAANGEILAYSMNDVKLIDGPASNIVEWGTFFGIASSYTAIELKDFDSQYLRPWAITPTAIALNIDGINVVHMSKIYHGFDGPFNRITDWKGGNGLDSATMVQQYCLKVNDHFKRSNIIPPSEFFGLFNGPPEVDMKANNGDRIANEIMDLTRQKGLDINIPGEDRDATRYSVPIHSEMLSTLPATVRMLAPYKLHVIDGVTSLTTDVRNTQTKYKAPSSVDFNLYDTMYRATEEYIALITLQDGIVAVEDKVPSAGLTFIGATTTEAFFYSPATRMYYSFSGGGNMSKQDIFNRFKDIKNGRWDFVNQEVVFKMLLSDSLFDDDVSGYFVGRLDNGNVLGELYPPNETIYNARSDFKVLSMAGGLVYQGPKRTVVNRSVITDDMIDQIKLNKRKWSRLDRYDWKKARDYDWKYVDWNTEAPGGAVYGWTHNPFRAATAMLGINEETDCLYEWELTFAWTEQLNKIFEQDEFISFNLAGETIGQGGTLLSEVTHLYLYKELFQNGYYTFRYTSKNGIGNRERLYMWGDGMSALEGLVLFAKEITTRRAAPLPTSQVDVLELNEQ